jgi:hypothetical protein
MPIVRIQIFRFHLQEMQMRASKLMALSIVIALGGQLAAAHAEGKSATHQATPETGTLVGAWRLVSMEDTASDGKVTRTTNVQGMLLYTRDGHLSVQVSYPHDASPADNDYVKGGYEASFGSYDVDVRTHTVTHHVEGANVADLVGRVLPRSYTMSGDRMTLSSTNPDEKWAVTWQHL